MARARAEPHPAERRAIGGYGWCCRLSEGGAELIRLGPLE